MRSRRKLGGVELAREISRSLYVARGFGRALALRGVYLAWTRLLLDGSRRARPEAGRALRARVAALFDRDWRDAEDGLYPRALTAARWRDYARAAPLLLFDLPRTRARIRAGRFDELAPELASRYPRYYARNFHFQTDGYLGHDSAELYDLQVELLFGGAADAMRRRLLPPVVRFARSLASGGGADGAGPSLSVLDVACGTGRLLGALGAALPSARLTGVDLSPHYVAKARASLPRELEVSLLVDNAEALPFHDARFDAVTCLFLFHELPAEVRARVLSEIARVVRPGGVAVLGDSLQLGDAPELAEELRAFPSRFHEPYYLGYLQDDLAAGAAAAGLRVEAQEQHFLTKVVQCRRP